jgi:hypothetical protein
MKAETTGANQDELISVVAAMWREACVRSMAAFRSNSPEVTGGDPEYSHRVVTGARYIMAGMVGR